MELQYCCSRDSKLEIITMNYVHNTRAEHMVAGIINKNSYQRVTRRHLGPLLLTWLNFDPAMDK